MAWVGVLAHELSHIILLRPGLVDRNEKDMALTDLLTVFLGFGIFTANSVFRFKQYSENNRQDGLRGNWVIFSKNNSGTRLGDTPTSGMK